MKPGKPTAAPESGHCYEDYDCRVWNPCSCRCEGCRQQPMSRTRDEQAKGCAITDAGRAALKESK